ncbi:MAG: nitroreductase family protein [Prevotella sp.]|nr:nitroreductase family protein [Bacteroides sp.]MCM1366773.1 nitroreductase family protein [Prevotella sp.]MCM1437392.1 nitroreductase family protein [Prevotella sp.]
MNYFKNRGTIRQYTSEKISDSEIDAIISAASKAPTTGNMQLYSVIVTKSDEGKRALSGAHFGQPMVESCSHLLTICADFHRFVKWCKIGHADAGFDNMLSFISAMTDAVIFAQQICTIAEMRGYGTCYLGTVTYNAGQIAEILGLPELVVPVACLSVGIPSEGAVETERLPLDAVRYNERYPEMSDEKIVELYKAKDDYEPNQQFIKENGKENLSQVFAEVRYPRSMNEEFSRSFIEFLHKQRFM